MNTAGFSNAHWARVRTNVPCILWTKHGDILTGEAGFYERLEERLDALGFQFVVASHAIDRVDALPVPAVGLSYIPRAYGFSDCDAVPSDSDEPVLRRFHEWGFPETDAPSAREIVLWKWSIRCVLDALDPALAVVWNGEHCTDLILREELQRRSVPMWYSERAFVPGFLHVDSRGILADSTLGRDRDTFLLDPAQEYESWASLVRGEGTTWYKQPHGLPITAVDWIKGMARGRKVVMFAGQVPQDAQAFRFSPHFRGPLEAFRWLVQQLPLDRYFVLGKHHPLSREDPGLYRAELGEGRGVWMTDEPMDRCLAVSDLFVTVNSTSAVEALLRGKVPFLLGDSILTGKGIAYEYGACGTDVVDMWLRQSEDEQRLQRWRKLFCYALRSHFHRLAALPSGFHGASDLAEALAAAALRGRFVRNPEVAANHMDLYAAARSLDADLAACRARLRTCELELDFHVREAEGLRRRRSVVIADWMRRLIGRR